MKIFLFRNINYLYLFMNKLQVSDKDKDKYPLFCLSFSPNWNTYQIISINEKGQLAYGTNSEIFLIDISNKDFITSIKPDEPTNFKIKVSSILLDESMIYSGFSDGTLHAYN